MPTSLEQACADSLTSNSALPSEILNELLDTWTTQPPFAYVGILLFQKFG